jgi:uncharacterized protein YjbI with pentapeptide repeats
LAGDSKFLVVRAFALAFGAWGGTCFEQADLTEADFAQAVLKNTSFYRATLSRTCFRGSKQLTRARAGDSILQHWQVLQLLIHGRDRGQDFTGADLRGAYLAGAELNGANLTRADLSQATLEKAELCQANLKEAAVVGTNFTQAHLTGACLEAWNIDSTTILKNVDCQFIFLLEHPNEFGDRERRPHDCNKIFADGEFEQFFKEVLDEVQILIKNGIQPEAFRAAMQKLKQEHDITSENITGFQRKGQDVQVNFQVPPGTDKGAVERTWDQGYAAGLAAANEQQTQLLQKHTEDMKDITLATVQNIGSLLSNLTISATAANNSNNPHISAGDGSFINTGTVSNSVVNLDEISGNVTNAINQLSDSSDPNQPSLKALLSRLQTAIETDQFLATEQQKDALMQVGILAEAGNNSQVSHSPQTVRQAILILKGLAADWSDNTPSKQVLNKLLPQIQGKFSA